MEDEILVTERRALPDRRHIAHHPMLGDLRAALATGTVAIFFQPQFRADGCLSGAEALARWEHPVHGVLAGDALVEIAESGGIECTLSHHVLHEALAHATKWPEGLRVSVNVTATDLSDPDFASDVEAALSSCNFPADRLTLEITEQALVSDLDLSAERLSRLAEQGIRIALDDFGAGFCNFRYLKLLPLDALKLDKSMVDGITEDERDLAILRGIVAMAHALRLCVTAEGIESEGQRQLVIAEGCDKWQGFLGGRPMAANEFARLAANG